MILRKLSAAYAGGASGALVALAILWLLGRAGVLSSVDIALRADLSTAGLYRLLAWGGIWGFLFLLPLWKSAPVGRGALFSLAPTAAILLVFYPRIGKGYLGFEYGVLTPVLIVLLGFLWGIFSAFWYRSSGG